MAKVAASDLQGKVEVKLNSEIALPKDIYKVRCKKEEAVVAKSSENYQFVRTWEIVSPEFVQVDGKNVRIAGTEMTQYLTIKCAYEKDGKSAEERTNNALARLFAENAKLGLPQEVDTENAECLCEGRFADAILGSDKYTQTKEPTAEQKAKGQPGEAIKDPITGKPIEKFTPRLIEIRNGCSNPAGL